MKATIDSRNEGEILAITIERDKPATPRPASGLSDPEEAEGEGFSGLGRLTSTG